MTPELLRDVEALCDAVAEEPVQNDYELGFRECVFCGQYIRMGARKPIDHDADCPVLIAKRIREEMKAV